MKRAVILFTLAGMLGTSCTSQNTLRRMYGEALANQELDRGPDARRIYNEIREAEPRFEGVRTNLAVLAARGDKGRAVALELLESEARDYPMQQAAAVNRVLLLLEAKRFQEALRPARALLADEQAGPLAPLLVGLALQGVGDWSASVDILRTAAKIDSKQAPRAAIHFALGIGLARDGRFQEAADAFSVVAKRRPNAVARYNLALMYLRLRKPIRAQQELARAAAIDDRAPQIPSLQAHASLQAGDLKAVMEAVERARALEPEEKAVDTASNERRDALRFVEGVVSYRLARYPEAVALFRVLAERTAPLAGTHFNLGMSLLRNDELKAAHASFAAAYKADKTDAQAQHNRDVLAKLLGL